MYGKNKATENTEDAELTGLRSSYNSSPAYNMQGHAFPARVYPGML